MQPDNYPNQPQQQQPQQAPHQPLQPYQGPPGGGPMPGGAPPPEYPAASQMKSSHAKGYLISLIVMTVLFLGVSAFAVWAFLERQEYKNETDAIVAREIEAAVAQNTEELEADFVEREKEPLTSYSGPAAFGGIELAYPKTWSAYIKESGGRTPIQGYLHPHVVPDETGDTKLALKVEVTSRSYQDAVRQFNRAADRGSVTMSPIEAVNVSGVVGTRIDGEISRDTQGSIVLFEIRDKTLVLTTESTEFMDDFNNIILENLSFNP